MTELKLISSSDTSYTVRKSYRSSHVAFSSILISMKMFTFEALPLENRCTFTDIMCQLSKEVAPCSSNVFLLHTGNQDIQRLMSILEKDFCQGGMLDQTVLGKKHPLRVAHHYGLMNTGVINANKDSIGEHCDFQDKKIIT